MILKMHAGFGDLSQFSKRENLIAAAVSQDRPVPIHEFVQTSEVFNHFNPWPDEQVIRIAKNDRHIQLVQFVRTDGFHAPLRSNRHERRRFNGSVRRR